MKLHFKNLRADACLSFLSALLVLTMITLLVSCSSGDEAPALPSITSFSPTETVPGQEVTITGKNLDGATSVQINGVEAEIKSTAALIVKITVPQDATTGKIKLTTPAGSVTTADDITVADFSDVAISDFEEEDAADIWHVAQDATEITTSEITDADESADGHYFHVVGSDVNVNYWLGGRYHETAGSTTPFGLQQTDASKVYFNVDVKKNNESSIMAKLVFAVYEEGNTENASPNRRTYEIDFPVTWTGWKTISIRADKFHYWNGSGFTTFAEHNGDIETMWSLALYITGGTVDGDNNPIVGDFSFDNVVISQKEALGEELNP